MKAIILSRVSTEEQREAGNSLPAQDRRCRDYAERKGFTVIKSFSFDESAYKDKREKFDQTIKFIEDQKEGVSVCMDKIDRLSRNVFDKRVSKLHDLAINGKIELHFVSDNLVIHKDISAIEKFNFSISLDNISRS